MTNVRRITEILLRPRHDFIYEVLRFLELGHCVDIGAAAGAVTRRICDAGGPHTEVVAFEPFVGNFEHFNSTVGDLTNVRLIKKAVSDCVGTAEFFVGSAVQGTEPGWEKFKGYSSVGFLESQNPTFTKWLKRAVRSVISVTWGRSRVQRHIVETTTIELELGDRTIDFMKIDVQGGEVNVLRGAGSMLEESRIGILYVEWSGEPEVVELLTKCGYRIYDSTYVSEIKSVESHLVVARLEEIGFEIVGEVQLSTGALAYELLLTKGSTPPEEAVRKVNALGRSWIQTDLIAINESRVDRFLDAVSRYAATLETESST